jgi:hypothetical protein
MPDINSDHELVFVTLVSQRKCEYRGCDAPISENWEWVSTDRGDEWDECLFVKYRKDLDEEDRQWMKECDWDEHDRSETTFVTTFELREAKRVLCAAQEGNESDK